MSAANQSTRSKIRNPFHRGLCETLKKISNRILTKLEMYPLNGERACADHLPVKLRALPQQNHTLPDSSENHMARRTAGFGFTAGMFRTILVDCTTASPLAKDLKIKDYRPGLVADLAVQRKVRGYKRYFEIDENSRCKIFFFAIETSYEARQYVKLLANLSGGPIGWEIQRIYQELAVEVQNSRANQVLDITRNKYETNQL